MKKQRLMKNFLITSVSIGSFISGSAVAGHKTHDFTGVYMGGNLGYGFGSGKMNAQGAGTELEKVRVNNDQGLKGVRGGVHLGYGHLFENLFYLAAELSGDYSNTESTLNNTTTDFANLNSFVFKGRRKDSFGFAVHLGGLIHSYLAYVKLGVDTARWNFNVTGKSDTGGGLDGLREQSRNKRLTGFVMGLGAETMLSEHIKFGGEITYTFYGKSPDLKISNAAGTDSITTNIKPRVADFRLRLSYKF